VTRLHGPERAATLIKRLTASGEAIGIRFRWEGHTGNTRDSHKLVLLARDKDRDRMDLGSSDDDDTAAAGGSRPGQRQRQHRHDDQGSAEGVTATTAGSGTDSVQDAFLAAMYKGAFEDGRDVSDRAFLIETAARVGLADEDEVRGWLDSDVAGRLVDREAARARDMDIQAVPSYVVQGRYRVGGCQEPGVFTSLFDKLRDGSGNAVAARG
jgi:predicted DsbA family dithiol-disulfide isomerase